MRQNFIFKAQKFPFSLGVDHDARGSPVLRDVLTPLKIEAYGDRRPRSQHPVNLAFVLLSMGIG